jgi:putative transposase
MFEIMFSLFYSIRLGLRSRAALHAQILALRHQVLVLQRSKHSHKVRLGVADRVLRAWLSQLWSGWRSAIVIVKPEAVIAWQRRGFPLYWVWKSRQGRPSVSREVIDLIHKMSMAHRAFTAFRIS